MDSKKHTVKVCVNINCKCNGSEKVFDALSKNLPENYTVSTTGDCFRFCKQGPNVAVDGQILHHMTESNGKDRVLRESKHPTIKKDAIGTRHIDELDDVLDEIMKL